MSSRSKSSSRPVTWWSSSIWKKSHQPAINSGRDPEKARSVRFGSGLPAMTASLAIGAFYNPHLAPVILDSDEISYLAVADSPSPHDPHWPAIQQRFTLLLHDHLGQLSEPLQDDELTRARALLNRYRSPWAAEHLQRIRPTAVNGHPARSLNYVFPPLYTEDFLDDYARNAATLREH